MSEDIKAYEYKRKDLDNIRSYTLLTFSNGWERPSSDEIRIVLYIAGEAEGRPDKKLTGDNFAKLVGVNPKTARRWIAPEDSANFQKMPYSAWRLLLQYAGIVEPEQVINIKNVAEG